MPGYGRSNGSAVALDKVSGKVTKTNETGFQLDGGAWYNYSQYDSVGEPPFGSVVTVEYQSSKNGKFYIKDWTLATHGVLPARTPTAGAPGGGRSYQRDETKERMIVRQSCIKAAADVLSGSGVSAADVIAYSKEFEAYVYTDLTQQAAGPISSPMPAQPLFAEEPATEDIPF